MGWLAAVTLSGCYLSHLRAEDGGGGDGGVHDASLDARAAHDAGAEDDAADARDGATDAAPLPDATAPHDTNPPALEAGACDPRTINFAEPCNADLDAFCESLATEWAFGRFGHTRCVNAPDGHNSGCTAGDYCAEGACRCTATRICGAYDVCVSDTPDGPRRCEPRCSGL